MKKNKWLKNVWEEILVFFYDIYDDRYMLIVILIGVVLSGLSVWFLHGLVHIKVVDMVGYQLMGIAAICMLIWRIFR